MIEKEKALELAKTVLIVLLTASFLFLGAMTGLFSELFGSVPGVGAIIERLKPAGSAPGGDSVSDGGLEAAAEPFYIAFTWEEGSRYGVKYGGRSAREMFDRFSAVLGEALGSSGEPEEITFGEWEAALSGSGVFFDYLNYQPLEAMSAWLGTGISSGAASHTARRVCLSEAGGGIGLCFLSGLDGAAYRCSTKLDARALSSRAAGLAPNGAHFVFEIQGNYPLIDRSALLTGDMPELELPEARNPFRFGLSTDDILEAFGMNINIANSYPEPDGSVVYVEGGSTLRVRVNDAIAVFRQTPEDTPADEEAGSLTDIVGAAYSFAVKSAGAYCGDAELCLSSLSFDPETDIWKFGFDYVFDSVPVIPRDAVTLEMSGGRITYAQVWFREYRFSGNTAAAMRENQAFALVQAQGGGEPVLVYDDADGEVTWSWVIR